MSISEEVKRRGKNIPRLQQQAELSKRKAEYLASPRGLAKETIKGLPEAAKKVGGAVVGGAGKVAKAIGYQLKGGKYGEEQGKRFDLRTEIKRRTERGLGPLKGINLFK